MVSAGARAVGIRVDSGQCGCRGSGRWTKYWAVQFATIYQGVGIKSQVGWSLN